MKKLKGFTIIELLMAVVVIAILSGILYITWWSKVQERTRDAQRITDVDSTRVAIEAFYEKNNKYPPLAAAYISQTIFTSDTVPPGANDWIPELVPAYSKPLPKDPKQASLPVYLALKIFLEKIFKTPLTPNAIWAQSTGPFLKTTGGADSDYSEDIQQTSDGGYIVTGSTYSFGAGNADVLLVKFDASGNVSWTKTVGWGNYDTGNSVRQTADGGYIVGGHTESFGAGSSDFLLIKFDSSGNVAWTKTVGGANTDDGIAVKQTSDGGYVMTGYSYSTGGTSRNVLLVKFDASGNTTWTKAVDRGALEGGFSVQQTSDGGYIVAGDYISGGNADVLLVKFDASGNVSWTKTVGWGNYEFGRAVQQTSDGGYIVAGQARRIATTNDDVLLVKFDASGNVSWMRTVGGNGGDKGRAVQQTSDGGYIVAGHGYSFGAGENVFLIKFDAPGNVSWMKKIDGGNSEYGKSIQQTTDGGYIVTGHTESFGVGSTDVLLIKTDPSGDISGCSYLAPASPTVSSPSPTVNSSSPTLSSPSLTLNSVSPAISSPSLTSTTQCPAPSPSPSPSPAPTFLYLYYVPTDRGSYQVWAYLENEKDPRIYTHPEAQCKATPPQPGYNFCGSF